MPGYSFWSFGEDEKIFRDFADPLYKIKPKRGILTLILLLTISRKKYEGEIKLAVTLERIHYVLCVVTVSFTYSWKRTQRTY